MQSEEGCLAHCRCRLSKRLRNTNYAREIVCWGHDSGFTYPMNRFSKMIGCCRDYILMVPFEQLLHNNSQTKYPHLFISDLIGESITINYFKCRTSKTLFAATACTSKNMRWAYEDVQNCALRGRLTNS